jgi:hypothetical protein
MAIEREKLLSAVERMRKARQAAIAAGLTAAAEKEKPTPPVEKAASSLKG